MNQLSSQSRFRSGDVLRYTPRRAHCKQGTAFVRDCGTPLDTYWSAFGDFEYGHLSDEELATAEVVFNVNDYDMLDKYSRGSRLTWETYSPDDRGRIGSQHQCQSVYFVRKGAQPDLMTQIQNARAALAAAESDLRGAQYAVDSRRRDLAKLEAALAGEIVQ
jgi:hypothetical protein